MRKSTVVSIIALAASTTAQFLNQSNPFALVVCSQNETYNGTTLAACHEGAAIDGLCIGARYAHPLPLSVETFTFNYSASQTADPSIGIIGYLTFELRGGNFNISEPMSLSYNPATNVAIPLFQPSPSGQEVTFSHDLLAIPSFLNDRVSPPKYTDTVYDRWYICETDAGYDYTTLAWVMGDTKPENPSCVKASIKRVFV